MLFTLIVHLPIPALIALFIFRNEEWFKALIHETFHNMGFDFSCIDSSIPDRVIYMITKNEKK